MCEISISRYTTRNYKAEVTGGKESEKLLSTRTKMFPNGPRREAAFTGILCSPELAAQIIYQHQRKRLQESFL